MSSVKTGATYNNLLTHRTVSQPFYRKNDHYIDSHVILHIRTQSKLHQKKIKLSTSVKTKGKKRRKL